MKQAFHAMRIFLLAAALTAAFAAERVGTPPAFDPAHYLDHVKYLAGDDLKGRFTGTPENDRAARYLAAQFEKFGLRPVPGSKTYFQPFRVTTTSKVGHRNVLAIKTNANGGHKEHFKRGDDFQPFFISGNGKAAGPLVFAGYGITAPEYNYDDYAGLDVKDKIVIVLRREPQENDDQSKFRGKTNTRHATFESKLTNAKQHGAKAILLVNNVGAHPDETEKLQPFARMDGPTENSIPYFQVRQSVAARWFTTPGKTLRDLEADIDKDLKPRSFVLDGVHVELQADVERVQRNTHNVIAYLPGETDEYLVVGAHYDHLGPGEIASLAPSQIGTPHLGADDNASGTAGMLELARYFAAQPKLRRGLLFMGYSGEELGLLGSAHYVEHPLLPLDKCAAMVNLDMIGRLRDSRLIVGGTGSASSFKQLIADLAVRHSGLSLDYNEPTGFGGSDHASFLAKQIPVLFYFSGLHADYHKPSDTWDKIDAPGAAKVLSLVADSILSVASASDRPQFIRQTPPPSPSAASTGGAVSNGYGPYFGSIPDMGGGVKGVKFSDVRAGSPAEKAGLKGGDVMVEFDGKPIENLYDYTYALRQKKVGDEVAVKVLRNGSPLEVKVKLEARR